MNHDNKPLTVDQMREMHDEVVIVKTLEYGQESKGILDFSDPNDSDNGVYVGCSFYSVESYGFFWIAYAQKPIYLDDWTAEWKEIVTHNGCTADYDCVCSKCGASGVPNDDFCSSCGRAISEKARELLERRLRNSENE